MARINITITEEILSKIKEIADREKRSISSMSEILLQQAIKERNRKKGGKNDGL
jgi:hypothetical protein